MYQKPRWTLLDNIINSKLAEKVHNMVFTSKVLGPACSEQLQLAPDPFECELKFCGIPKAIDLGARIIE